MNQLQQALHLSNPLPAAGSVYDQDRPVIVDIHGGPKLASIPSRSDDSDCFRNEIGITIIYPNVRGSAGSDARWERDDGRKRADVVKDIGALLDWIATQPTLNRDRVHVTGPAMTAVYRAHGHQVAIGSAACSKVSGSAIW